MSIRWCLGAPSTMAEGTASARAALAAALMSAIYDEHKDDDGFLYISYSGENTFGGLRHLHLAC